MLSIIIPVYNEQKTIYNILEAVRSVDLINGMNKQLVVVNDCSKDNSLDVIYDFKNEHPEMNILVVSHQTNKGKGAALHSGIFHATGDYIIVQDADLEYDPNEFNILLKPILDGHADVVYGSRFIGGKPHRVLFFFHTIGNKLLTLASNVFSGLNLTDMETCYKLFKADIIKSLSLKETRFGFEPEVTAKIAKIKNIRIYEVGVSYYGRTYEEGKKIGWKDGFRAIYCIVRYSILN
jgi:glycosyltransferase involved in cell wall biosynthesis